MSVHNWVVQGVQEAIKSGSAVPGQVVVSTDPDKLGNLRNALTPVFEDHRGQIIGNMPGANALLLGDLPDSALKAVANLGPVRTLRPVPFG